MAEPKSANDYDPAVADAAKSVIIEMTQVLGAYVDKFVLIGGAVPWLLLEPEDMEHVGTLDIDIGLDAEALRGGEYKTLIKSLTDAGYKKTEDTKKFQLVREVQKIKGGPTISIVIDFMMPRDVQLVKRKTPLLKDFVAQRADGAELALQFNEQLELKGEMPDGAKNTVTLRIASIPALLAMKGHAIDGRQKNKDAYDIYFSVRNYPGGPEALAEACLPLLKWREGEEGFRHINTKFETADHYGPRCVRTFVEELAVLGDMSANQWQQDAFAQVDAWLKALGIRKGA